MAIQYIDGATNMVKGIDAAELGFKIESFRQSMEPQFIEPSFDEDGHRDGGAIGHKKTEVTMSGEIVYSTGALQGAIKTAITAGAFDTAVTLGGTGNSEGDLESGGGLYITSLEITKDRGSWQAMSVTMESYADQS